MQYASIAVPKCSRDRDKGAQKVQVPRMHLLSAVTALTEFSITAQLAICCKEQVTEGKNTPNGLAGPTHAKPDYVALIPA